MSGWVHSAKKFVVSSFVTFAEELEHAVLLMTDAEQTDEDGHLPQRNTSVECDGAKKRPPTIMYVASGVVGTNHALAILPASYPAISEPSALTTQPQPSDAILSTSSSMTSLPAMSSRASSLPQMRSGHYSHSLPEIANSSKCTRLGCHCLTPSKSSKSSSTPIHVHSQIPSVHEWKQSRHLSPNATQMMAEENQSFHSSTRPRDYTVSSLKMPGKVVRTSAREIKSTQENQRTESPDDEVGATEGLNTYENKDIVMDDKGQHSTMIIHHSSSYRSPEDLSMREHFHEHIRPTFTELEEEHNDIIQRVSLMDKFTKILHSTLITISNLLQMRSLENEERLAICENEINTHLQDSHFLETKIETTVQNDGFQMSESNESTLILESVSDNRLAISRISSIVSLESFEVLSKDDGDNIPCVSVLAHSHPSSVLDSQCHSQVRESSPQDIRFDIRRSDENEDNEYSDMQMTSSIEFIQFEVSDLITKRYFDSKTKRLTPSTDVISATLNNGMGEGKQISQNLDTVVTQDDCRRESFPKSYMEIQSEGDDDESSASFDIISEDACREPFHILE